MKNTPGPLKIRSWRWFAGQGGTLFDCLTPETITSGIEVKHNPKRSVRRIECTDGKMYFVKEEILRPLALLFRNKARTEFSVSERLEQLGIPCVHFIARGEKHAWRPRTRLVSEEVENAVSAKEFWCSAAGKDPQKRACFLDFLARLLKAMMENGVRHRDFHAGNLLVSRDTCRLTLVDLIAIRRVPPGCVPAEELGRIATDFLPGISDSELEELLSAISDQPMELARELKRGLKKRIAKEWNRRRIQILSGDSKFSRTQLHAGRVFEIASTPWFEPGVFADPQTLRAETFPAPEAKRRWLAFFRARLEGERFSPRYLMRERCGGTEILYSGPGKDVDSKEP